MEGSRVTLAKGDIDSVECGVFGRPPATDGREAGTAEEVVRAIQGTGIQPGRGGSVDAER
jgi:hypothetical protein